MCLQRLQGTMEVRRRVVNLPDQPPFGAGTVLQILVACRKTGPEWAQAMAKWAASCRSTQAPCDFRPTLRSVHRHAVSAPDSFGVVFFKWLLQDFLGLGKSDKDILIAEVEASQGQLFEALLELVPSAAYVGGVIASHSRGAALKSKAEALMDEAEPLLPRPAGRPLKQTLSKTTETLESLNATAAQWDVFTMNSAPSELATLCQQWTSAWRVLTTNFEKHQKSPLHTDGPGAFLTDGPKDHAQSRSPRKCFSREWTPEQRIVDTMRSACPKILMVRSMVEHSLIVYPSLPLVLA